MFVDGGELHSPFIKEADCSVVRCQKTTRRCFPCELLIDLRARNWRRKFDLAWYVFKCTLTRMAASLPTLSALAQELQRRTACRPLTGEACSTGVPALDQLLPQRGLKTGSLTEWMSDSAEGGLTFALLAASRALKARDTALLAVIDRDGEFYPAALPGWDVPLDRTILIRPTSAADALWTWEQSLRCPGIAACVGWLPVASSVAMRRLQVAAEHGGGQGLLVRPLRALKESAWADVRWRVTPAPISAPVARAGPIRGRRFRVELVRCRSQFSGGVAEVEFSPHAANPVRLVPAVADPAAAFRAAGDSAPAARAV